MKTEKKIMYCAYFPDKKSPFYVEPDSGGWYVFSKEPDGFFDTPEQAKANAPHVFGSFTIRKFEIITTTYSEHQPFALRRTPKNKWIACCDRCGIQSKKPLSTIQFALDNVTNRAKEYGCSTVIYNDLGKV